MRSLWRLGMPLLQGFLIGGWLHLVLLNGALGRAASRSGDPGGVVQDLQDDLLPSVMTYLLTIFAVLLIRVLVHAFTLDRDDRQGGTLRAGAPSRSSVLALLRRPWAPGRRQALALHLGGAGLARWANLWWVHETAYSQWPP